MRSPTILLFLLSACASSEPSSTSDAAKAPSADVVPTAEIKPDVVASEDVVAPVRRGDANVDFVRVVASGDSYSFSVTVQHDDKGWEDYCDGWDVVLPSGEVVKLDAGDAYTRVLLHPHDAEPFTRSQSGLVFEGESVLVRAHDLVDGFGGREVRVDLSASSGEGFVVER